MMRIAISYISTSLVVAAAAIAIYMFGPVGNAATISLGFLAAVMAGAGILAIYPALVNRELAGGREAARINGKAAENFFDAIVVTTRNVTPIIGGTKMNIFRNSITVTLAVVILLALFGMVFGGTPAAAASATDKNTTVKYAPVETGAYNLDQAHTIIGFGVKISRSHW